MPASARDYARLIYCRLREADALGVAAILVEAPPAHADWAAIRDRLLRAAHAHSGQDVLADRPADAATAKPGRRAS